MPRTTLLRVSTVSLVLFFSATSFAQTAVQSGSSAPASYQNDSATVPNKSAEPTADPRDDGQAQENWASDQNRDSSNAYSHARIVRLSHVDGDVRIDRGDKQGFIKAFSNMPLVEGARLWTEADGRAEAEFEDGSTIRLTPNSMLDFGQLQLGKNGERLTTVSLERGEAYFGIKKRSADAFTVKVDPNWQGLQVKKDSHFRVTADKDGVKIAEFTGALELLKQDGQRVAIGKNESLSLDAADPQRYFLAHGTPAAPLDSWDHERDQQEAMTVTNQNLGYNAVYNTAMYSYGYEDLARYGNYIYSKYGFLDSFNRSFTAQDATLSDGRVDPGFGWIAKDYLGIDQGPILAMICNYRNELVWEDMRKSVPIRRGLERAGFSGGWLNRSG